MIQHNCYDLGTLEGDELVEVTLSGNAAYIRLMEIPEYDLYKQDQPYKFFGGLAMQSPYNIIVPNAGRWFVVVDMQGLAGTVLSSMKVIKKDGSFSIPATVFVQGNPN